MTRPFDNVLGLSAQALPLRSRRMELLAANIANADTPNYQARDLDFAKALDAAEAASRAPAANRGIGASTADLRAAEVFRVPLQPSMDGNTVDAQVENAQFAQAAIQYQASLMFVDANIRGLLTAIKGE
jgi:flagellar basal-body rod protein FlgB